MLQSSNPTLLEEVVKIERQYPSKKQEKSYPERYDVSVFERLNQINADTQLQNHYKKWKDGINYDTNRKIRIGGKIHEELKGKFMITYTHYKRGGESRSSIFFEELININIDEYLQETKAIHMEVDTENALIEDYNKLVDSIIEKIQKLERWNEFIEFEGRKYGLMNKIKYIDDDKKNIHIENDCFGEMVFSHKETSYTFIDRPFCNYADKEHLDLFYKCSKCNYENKMSTHSLSV